MMFNNQPKNSYQTGAHNKKELSLQLNKGIEDLCRTLDPLLEAVKSSVAFEQQRTLEH